MCRSVTGLLSLAVHALWVTSSSCIEDCRCPETTHCRPLSIRKHYPVELFAFHGGGKDWKHYAWSKITTIVTSGTYIPELLCHAHAYKVRVVMEVSIGKDDMFDHQARFSWISNKLNTIQVRYLDGVYLIFNSALVPTFSSKLPTLIEEMQTRLTKSIPGSQISFRVPWICNTSTTVCSDLVSASKHADYVHVISFDVQLHMWTDCFAKANAPYHQTLTGIASYIKNGINSKKVILTVPWFGYDYTCKRFFEAGRCEIEKIAFDGAPCSAARASGIPYSDIMKLLPKSISGRIWDDDLKAPFFVYKLMNGLAQVRKESYRIVDVVQSITQTTLPTIDTILYLLMYLYTKDKAFHEVWYDDPESISLRTTFLKRFKVGGIGMLNANFANYSSDPIAAMKTEEMWNALCPP